jgi:hypothetical protein
MQLVPIGGISLDDVIYHIRNELSTKLNPASAILDGVSLEELVNFAVPLSSQQTPDQIHDGVLLGYKDGKLVEETSLNGGEF